MHRTTRRFWNRFHELPPPIQKIAQEHFAVLEKNPRHPSLHFKKVGKLWSVRVGLDYRALAVQDGTDFIWVWIGSHDEYKQMIKTMG
jgi:mRNA-degrading endonuclease RelE of RelBE toxin-antitoxin system